MKKLPIKILATVLGVLLMIGSVGVAYALGTEKSKTDDTDVVSVDTSKSDSKEENELIKDETVYVLAGNNGEVKKIIVSDWIKNAISESTINDKTELSNVENVKGNEKYTINGDKMTVWDAEGNDIYYQGDIEKELPVGLSISYTLDGKNVSASEIAGKSGKATIRFDYTNYQYEMVEIDGKEEKIYVPFVMLTGMLLDSTNFRNVEVSNGKLINDGNRTAVIGFAMPGLQDNLGLDKDKLEIPDYVEITADVTDFSLGMTVTIATNSLFNNLDMSKLDKVDGLKDSLSELTSGMNQLLDGSSALYNGLSTLLDKSNELVNGINKLADGAKTLKDGVDSLSSGVNQLNDGINDLASGLNELNSHNEELNGGAKQVFDTLLLTAQTQLKANGLTCPDLTIDNYEKVLNGVISSLDENKVYNQALNTVEAAVEANRSVITDKVTAAVKEEVSAKVIYAATNGQMTKDTYEAAKSAGLIDETTIAKIDGAINAQMRSDDVKALINEQVELQIKKLISDNMASDEVQGKLKAASEGAKSVIALKSSLDKYNSFYIGLIAYTDGVSTAADGAGKLNVGSLELKAGTDKLKDGVSTLYDGILELKDGTPALVEGVSKLKDGAMQLSDGINKLNDEGISKLTGLVENDLSGVMTRLRATLDVSKNYKNFSGISDNMDGQVKFIYRTEEINAE